MDVFISFSIEKVDVLIDKQLTMTFNREHAKGLIEQKGRTRRWVAEECCIDDKYFTAILNGHSQPSRAVVKLMAIALETNETDLWLGNEAETKKNVAGGRT